MMRTIISGSTTPLPMFDIDNEVVQINSIPQVTSNGYVVAQGDTIQIDMDIVDSEGNLLTSLDQSSLGVTGLKLPLVKYLDGIGSQILDKIYFDATLVLGHVTITGTFGISGDWKLTQEKTNQAMAAVNAGFEINRDPITFLV